MSALLLSSLLATVLAADGISDAEVPPPEREKAIYGHPTTTLASLNAAAEGTAAIHIPVTYEREFGDGKSWTLQPTLVFGSQKQYDTAFHSADHDPTKGYDLAPDLDVFEIQLLGTQRNYFNGNVSKGWYWAPAIKLDYSHVSQPFKQGQGSSYWPAIDENEIGIALLGYVGWRGKWGAFTMYIDGGLGWQYVRTSGNGNQVYIQSDLVPDLDIGIGRAF